MKFLNIISYISLHLIVVRILLINLKFLKIKYFNILDNVFTVIDQN